MPAKIITVFLILSAVGLLFSQDKKVEISDADLRAGLAELSRLGAKKPFLKDAPDVYLEPKSLNRFFTDRIYQKLEGNAYFGYRFDEGFSCGESEVSIEEIRDLTGTTGAAYRYALEKALTAAKYQIKPDAACRIGVCIVGIEAKETERTLPGVMAEAYLRNASAKKSFFIRYGVGSPNSLSAAIQMSAELLTAELESRREHH